MAAIYHVQLIVVIVFMYSLVLDFQFLGQVLHFPFLRTSRCISLMSSMVTFFLECGLASIAGSSNGNGGTVSEQILGQSSCDSSLGSADSQVSGSTQCEATG